MTEPSSSRTPSVSRRRLLGYAGAGAAVGAAGFAGGIGAARATDGPDTGGVDRYAFHGTHQAGIVTPAQDRLHFAAFDVTATSRAELLLLLKAWTAAAAAMTQGRPVGRRGPAALRRPARGHRRGRRPPARPADADVRVRPVAVPRRRRPGPLRPRRPAARGAAPAPALPRRRPAGAAQRRRPLRAGLRRRPPGRRARDPQPVPHRVRQRRAALVPARLRAYVVHVDLAGHPAQPVRLQGRHRQPQGRGAGGRRRARLGRPGRRRRRRVARRTAPTWSPAGST